MPITDLYVTLQITQRPGNGKPDRSLSVTYRVPADSTPGLTLTAGHKTKIGAKLEGMGTLLDEQNSDL